MRIVKPTWDSAIKTIDDMRHLKSGWGGACTKAIPYELVDSAVAVAKYLKAKGELAPTQVSPIEDGGVAMAWSDGDEFRHYEFLDPYIAEAFTWAPGSLANYEEIDFKGIAMPTPIPVTDVWIGRIAIACRFAFIWVIFFCGTVFVGQWCGCGKARSAEPSYRSVEHRVLGGETLVVYAGVTMPTTAEANAVRVDAIPGEPKGVYDCFRKDGTARMVLRGEVPAARGEVPAASYQPSQPYLPTLPTNPTRPRRIVVAGKYYDQFPDGHLVACST